MFYRGEMYFFGGRNVCFIGAKCMFYRGILYRLVGAGIYKPTKQAYNIFVV